MRKKVLSGGTILQIIAAAVSLAVLGGCDRLHDDGHAGHDSDAPGARPEAPGDGHHDEEGPNHVELSAKQRKRINLVVAEAGPGTIVREVTFPGEMVRDPDRVAHVTPRVSGFVRETRKNLGDPVSVGDVLAVLESRELAEAKAAFLAAHSRLLLAEVTFRREETLWKEKKISAKQDYLIAQQAYEEAQIESRTARQRLLALGFSTEYLDRLPGMGDEFLTRYDMTSPIDGVVVEKHAVLGELLRQEEGAFTVADLRSVWVVFNVYQKDLALVKPGQEARIRLGPSRHCDGTVRYVSPVIDGKTRTVQARVVLENRDGALRPGLYVTVCVKTRTLNAPVVIPRPAVQILDERPVVFVEEGDGFEAVPVELGATDRDRVVVTSGLQPGQRYVEQGAFDLKAKIVTRGLGSHAGHGH